ncbi:MAG TPA: hypothetical protein VGX27_00830 [Candidatus Dormibacteraeota bacterium]|nr:hypothetical protein [Candidatus Dormibacteraeota bacterium]
MALVLVSCGASSSQPKVLLTAVGNGTAKVETIDASKAWEVLWRYNCAPTGVFAMDVLHADGTPDFDHPGINEEGDSDSGTYRVPEAGRFYLEVTTTCSWTVKIEEPG